MRAPFRSLALPILVAIGLVSSACGDDGDDGDDGGRGGTAMNGGSAGTGGKASAGEAGVSGRNGGSGGTRAGASGAGASSSGRGGMSSAGSDSGGSEDPGGGSGGDAGAPGAGTGGSGGNPTPGECGMIATFEDGLTPERELFVDADASGSGDGSAEAPFSDLEAALAVATPGTAVRIRPGTYAGGAFVSGLDGTVDAPIWIGGVPGEARPVIEGGDVALQLSGASFLVVHDLEITGQTSNGLNVDDRETASGETHDLVFRNLSISDLGDGGNQDCLKLSGVDRYFVLDSEFVGCSGGSAIDHVGCHDGVVARNLFRDLGGNGVQSKGGSRNIEIRQNRFFDAGERAVNLGGSTGFEFFRPALSTSEANTEASDIRVVGNVFRGGISPIAYVGCVGCLVANNTIVEPDHWVVRVLQETVSEGEYEFLPASDGRFVNNIVYYSIDALSTHVNVGPDTAAETFEFSNNLWYAWDAPANSQPHGLPAVEDNGIYGEDPGFADAESDDFAIADGSPGAAAGVAVVEVPSDLNGDCYREPPSVGADETE